MTDKKYEVRDWGSCNHDFELLEDWGDEHGYIDAKCVYCGATAVFVCDSVSPPDERDERCVECDAELESCVCEYCSKCGTNMDYYLTCSETDATICEDCEEE